MKPRLLVICGGVLVLLLIARYYRTFFLYDFPLGYDAGIYRYLFVKHGEAWPPFVLGEVDDWARGHPLGLFMLATPFLKLGLPVDWLIGWIWNAVPVVLVLTLAWVVGSGPLAGRVGWKSPDPFGGRSRQKIRSLPDILLATLLVCLLSVPLYDAFFAMYWKSLLAMLFMVLAFAFLDRKSPWAFLFALLTLITHTQTGLLLALVLGSGPLARRAGGKGPDPFGGRWYLWMIIVVLVAALVYLPVWQETISVHLPTLLAFRGENVPAGSFPSALFYLRVSGILLVFGVAGFVMSLVSRLRGSGPLPPAPNPKGPDPVLTPWHLAVLFSAAFVLLKLFFYRRFFLHLDFFLLPFAASFLVFLFERYPSKLVRSLVILLLVTQGVLSHRSALARTPTVDPQAFEVVKIAEDIIPPGSEVIVLENITAHWFLGWLTESRVGAPGLFSIPGWSEAEWEQLLYGPQDDRRALLAGHEYYLVATPVFYGHYGDVAKSFLSAPCVSPVEEPWIYRTTCP